MIPEYLNKNLNESQKKTIKPIYSKIQESTSDLGGIYNDSDNKYYHLKLLFNALVLGYSKIEFVRTMPPIFLEIVNSVKLNAKATLNKPFYFILVYKGILDEVEYFLDSVKQDENFNDLNQKTDDQDYSHRLRVLIHNVLLEHELSHILNGHLDYLDQLNSNYGIDESNKESSNNELNSIIQTMEMDADCTALSRLYAWLNQHSTRNMIDANYFASREDTFSDLLMSFYLLNKFYFDLSSYNTKLGTQKSLTPKERISIIFSNLLANITRYKYDVDLELLLSKYVDKIFYLEEWFNKEQGVPINAELLKNEIFKETELNKLTVMNWKKVRPELLKYNYIDLVKEIQD